MMKKIIFLAVAICLFVNIIQAQTSCSPVGIDQFYPTKTSMRVGMFNPPYDHIDSIGCYSIAFGVNTKANGYSSIAIGSNTESSQQNSFAAGMNTKATGYNSFVTGFSGNASGAYSAGFGYWSNAAGNTSFVTGKYTQANGDYSFAGGQSSIAGGQSSFAIGESTKAFGITSFATGFLTEANGASSFAGGQGSIANGLRSFTFGDNNITSNYLAVAMGSNTNASGMAAFALGYYSKASGNYSLALGSYAEARATDNFAAGKGTITKAMNGIALGTYNDSTDNPNPIVFGTTDRIFQVGTGGSASSRANALTILRNGNTGIGVLNPAEKLEVSGNIKTSGNVTVQGKGIIRSNDATQQKKLVANVVVNATFTAGQTKTFTVTWPETFGAAPDAFVGSLVSGAGGWAEVVMSLGTTTTTGVTFYVYNPKTISVSPNFTIKVVAIGAQ